MGKRQSFQQVLLGHLDSCMQISETRTNPHTMHKNKLKMAERLKYKTRHHQIPRREHRKTFSDINLTNIFSGQSPKATEIRAKINQWDLNQTDKILHSKGNPKENKKTTYRMGENSFKRCN